MPEARTPRIPSLLRAAVAAAALAPALSCAPAPAPWKGDVLLVTVDALRPDYMSMNGYDRPTTPFLDALLAGGYYFDEAITTVSRTTPALASLLTGAYPHTTGVRRLTDALRGDEVTLAEVMAGAGYQTIAVVSNTLLVPERGLGQGFDVYDMWYDNRVAQETTDALLRHLDDVDPNRPVFAWVHYIDPHVPYHTDPNLAMRMDPGYAGPYALRFGWSGYPGSEVRAFSAFPRALPKVEATHRNKLPSEVNAHIRRLYAADILSTDGEIERLISGVRARRGEDLMVVLTADHGESLGEHGLYFDHGDYVYNASTRVPLGIVLPESHPLHGSGRCKEWVSLVDVVPTLLDLTGREAPAAMKAQIDGRSLAPCMRGEPLPPAPLFAESGVSFYPQLVPRRQRNDTAGKFRSVVEGEWKLIWTPFLPDEDAWELYHMPSDPDETLDLYDANLPEVAPLKAHLQEWLADEKADGTTRSLTEEDLEYLRTLGYVE